MESTAKDIHQVLGNLRRRIDELSKGDYSEGYKYELPKVEAYIDHFPPDIIIKYLSPLIQQLSDISEDVFQKVSDDPHEEINQLVNQGIDVDPMQYPNITGKSRRDLMRKEVSHYIETIQYYIRKYGTPEERVKIILSKPPSTTSNTIRYKQFNARGNDKLKDLHNSLLRVNYIDHIKFRDFEKVFSCEHIHISTAINWKKDKSSFRYFLRKLFAHEDIVSNGNVNWVAVKNCFRYKGEIIEPQKMKGYNHDPANAHLLDLIVSNL
jgi:hypothetical protein